MKTGYVCLLAAVAGIAFAQDSRTTGWIVIPVSEYSALRGKVFPPEREPSRPPIEATLTRVDYNLHADGEIASGHVTLTIDVLKNGWVLVPLPAGLAVREARLAGKPVSLIQGANSLSVLLAGTGRSVLDLEVAASIGSGGGEERLTLPPGSAGITRAAVSLARGDLDLKIAGGLLSDRIDAEGETRWVAFADGNAPLVFTWRRRMDEQKRQPVSVRTRGSLAQLVLLSDETTTISAEVNIDVVQGAARAARVAVPASVTVNTVTGPNVADWEIRDGMLSVSFLEPVEKKSSFVLSGETTLPREGAIDLPMLRLLDSERDAGGIAVEVLGAGEIRSVRPQGLERTEAAELSATLAARQSPSLAAFRYRTGPGDRSLSVNVARYTQQAVLTANVEEARYRVLLTPDGKTLVEARYAVRNNQRNFMRLSLPAGAVLWGASLAGRPVQPGGAPDGSLLLPLTKSRAGEDTPVFPVDAVYLVTSAAWSEKGHVTVPLPHVDLPVSRTGVLLYHPPQERVAAEPGAFRTLPFEAPVSAALQGQALANLALPALAASPAQALVDRYRAQRDARRPGDSMPLEIAFPAVGPSIYLAGELTAENQSPVVTLNYQKSRKEGRQ